MNKCPKCGETGQIVGVEYGYGHPYRYDGVSEWQCLSCGYRQGRWSGKELGDKEFEPRWGGKQ